MLTTQDLYSLEHYSIQRADFKLAAVTHRRQRQVRVGNHMTLHFEDAMTVKYQIQEMLFIEKTFDRQGIQDELDAYTPLIPTGRNLKATLTIEYGDAVIRAEKLRELHGVEHQVYVQVAGHDRVYAIANEDMPRSTDAKTAAVHFLRFEFTDAMIQDLQHDHTALIMGVDHPAYQDHVGVDNNTKMHLLRDFAVEHQAPFV
jgi:glycerol-3-phosphate dehydrogenase subunit C